MRRLLTAGFGDIVRRCPPEKGGSLPQHLVNRRLKQELRLELRYPVVHHGIIAAHAEGSGLVSGPIQQG